jgi:hypothetical protein
MYVRLNEKEVSPTLTIGALLDIAAADSYIDPPLCESYLYTFRNWLRRWASWLEKNWALRVCLSSNYCNVGPQ